MPKPAFTSADMPLCDCEKLWFTRLSTPPKLAAIFTSFMFLITLLAAALLLFFKYTDTTPPKPRICFCASA